MLEMVEARRTSGDAEHRYDLLSGLLDASQDELDDKAALSDEELIGKHTNFEPIELYLTSFPRKYVYFPSCWT
jgi:hypothetical protein